VARIGAAQGLNADAPMSLKTFAPSSAFRKPSRSTCHQTGLPLSARQPLPKDSQLKGKEVTVSGISGSIN
jgi:hypothetical protein